jgi:purine-binding chemotaxis protein CheW
MHRSTTEHPGVPSASGQGQALVVAVGSRFCSIQLEHLTETMRPLPIEAVAGMPPFVLGLSVIRGAPVPVVDLAAAMGTSGSSAPSRFVLLKVGDRRVALAVDAVVGVRDMDVKALERMPPLLQGASADLIEAIGALDTELLVALDAARLLTEDAWRTLDVLRTGP